MVRSSPRTSRSTFISDGILRQGKRFTNRICCRTGGAGRSWLLQLALDAFAPRLRGLLEYFPECNASMFAARVSLNTNLSKPAQPSREDVRLMFILTKSTD